MKQPHTKPRGRALRWLARLLLYGTLLGVGGFAGMIWAALPELPRLENAAELREVEGAIYARDGRSKLRTLRAPTTRHYATEREITPLLASAVVAAEDHSFYRNYGIDPRGIARAALADLRAREIRQGGSTITQQLVKNSFVGSEQTLGRKSREALLAIALEARWTKRRILTAYLNTAYFGAGAYGVRDAAQTYFGVPVRKLDAGQSAMLAGLLQSPSTTSPFEAPQAAKRRRGVVLDQMLELGSIDRTTWTQAKTSRVPGRQRHDRSAASRRESAPHFTDGVIAELLDSHGAAKTFGGGLRVRTTLDVGMQRAANTAVREINGTGLSTAIVAIDPRNGELRALALGGPAARDAFDVASQGRRQPGSAFKPFVLAAAYRHGLRPKSKLLSAPFSRTFPPPIGKYDVRNDSGLYTGRQSLEQATWASDNTVFARVAQKVGNDQVIEMARAAGITSRLDDLPSLPLGALAEGVSPIELAGAYATFANHGVRVRPHRLRSVRTKGGKRLTVTASPRETAMPAPLADAVTATLQGVVTRGTGTKASIGRPSAGKTGTTEHNADAWFVGYTPTLVAAVWVGHAEGSVPMQTEYHGLPVTGGSYPAEIWASFMRSALTDRSQREFELRQMRYLTLPIDPTTGLLAGPWCARSRPTRVLDELAPKRRSEDCPDRERVVPDMVGLTEDQARRRLEAAEFRVQVRRTIGNADRLEHVVDQIPAAGDPIDRRTAIQLYVVDRILE